jgi:hypothetical protein
MNHSDRAVIWWLSDIILSPSTHEKERGRVGKSFCAVPKGIKAMAHEYRSTGLLRCHPWRLKGVSAGVACPSPCCRTNGGYRSCPPDYSQPARPVGCFFDISVRFFPLSQPTDSLCVSLVRAGQRDDKWCVDVHVWFRCVGVLADAVAHTVPFDKLLASKFAVAGFLIEFLHLPYPGSGLIVYLPAVVPALIRGQQRRVHCVSSPLCSVCVLQSRSKTERAAVVEVRRQPTVPFCEPCQPP